MAFAPCRLSHAPRRPKRPPRPPQGGRRSPQESPKTAPESLKTAQEAPKTAQEAPKTGPRWAPEQEQEAPRTPREVSRTPPGPPTDSRPLRGNEKSPTRPQKQPPKRRQNCLPRASCWVGLVVVWCPPELFSTAGGRPGGPRRGPDFWRRKGRESGGVSRLGAWGPAPSPPPFGMCRGDLPGVSWRRLERLLEASWGRLLGAFGSRGANLKNSFFLVGPPTI